MGAAGQVAAFEAGVVVGAHPGEHRDLFATQSFDPPLAAEERNPGLFGGEPFPAGGEEVADLVPVVHVVDRTTSSVAGGTHRMPAAHLGWRYTSTSEGRHRGRTEPSDHA